MSSARILSLSLWLLLSALCVVIVARARYVADLSAFLPRSPSASQQLLVQQLQDGLASRLILIGLEGADEQVRAQASRSLAAALRVHPEFVSVNNGEPGAQQKDQQFIFDNRYLLSSTVTPERFSVEGMQAAIGDTLDLITSPAGLLAKSLLQSDPTGETLQVIDQLSGGRQPDSAQGVWSSRQSARALLIAQTRANGSDTDAQEQALNVIRSEWSKIATPELHLLTSSPGKFAVESRATIKHEAARLSLLSSALIAVLLLTVYRSAPTLLLGFLPVLSGALAGVAAVALGFGLVHGITLGFGVTLIGESVDYSIYLFVQPRASLWPTMMLGVLTSICGFASLLPSSFPGLAQLGLFSISGLIAAAAVTRFVLPHLLGARLRMANLAPLGARTVQVMSRLQVPAAAFAVLALACAIVLYVQREHLWNRDIAALSPASEAAQRLDAQLRSDLAAPDIGSLIVITGADEQAVLQLSERVGAQLEPLIAQGAIAGYDSPARYLPSDQLQARRRASLPAEGPLRERVAAVSASLGLQPKALEPFVQQVSAARSAAPITRASFDGTSLALSADALLWHAQRDWHAMLPLRPMMTGEHAGEIDLGRVRQALAGIGQVLVLNIKQETEALYGGYLSEAIRLSVAGFAAIVLLLILTLRNARRVMRVIVPLLLAVLAVVTVLALAGTRLTILHLVGMLLIVAVGSNYALFFDRRVADAKRDALPLTLASLLIANTCTVIGFGVLAFSSVPVLSALGTTVAPGTLLALWFSALIAPRDLWA